MPFRSAAVSVIGLLTSPPIASVVGGAAVGTCAAARFGHMSRSSAPLTPLNIPRARCIASPPPHLYFRRLNDAIRVDFRRRIQSYLDGESLASGPASSRLRR